MNKITLTLAAIGALAGIQGKAAESPVPTVYASTETPAYLKQEKPAVPAATPAQPSFIPETKEQRDDRMA